MMRPPRIPQFGAGNAQVAGNAGYGFAKAGEAISKLGQSYIDNDARALKLANDKKHQETMQGLQASQVSNNFEHNKATQALNQSKYDDAVHERNLKMGGYATAYANQNPNDPMVQEYQQNPTIFNQSKLGYHAMGDVGMRKETPQHQNFSMHDTKDGVLVYNKTTGEYHLTPYKPKASNTDEIKQLFMQAQITAMDERNQRAIEKQQLAMDKQMQAISAKAEYEYGDTWADLPLEQKKYAIQTFSKTGAFPKAEGTWIFDGDVRLGGFNKQPQQPDKNIQKPNTPMPINHGTTI